ncbi:MAG: PEP-CTERM sorting domain-containing protein [Desulfomicrobium sp.]|nr:PEP-CTERM sorting domain-containing protein [Pseudomonadota bacterium]MBV1712254.1 PEP-CTERM sorting domain-containing protein [Desulfomicrobium sp.]MBU4572891.1 PEP-CTERM sorting domain-containing protein [Pseudomonadota bacterium]MBU4594886.1 PEP-CTERM sorting domain-containing protein [Pseudomonadota bacterium]MBV1718474.1 PEP-CTERM sorting domain-containing protein [Desulfomicrobium sp.]
MKKKMIAVGLALLASAGIAMNVHAGSFLRAAYQDAALAIDGWGSQSSSSGFLQTGNLGGSSVLAAWLYSADVWGGGVAGDVTLEDIFLPNNDGILLSRPASNPVNVRLYDVTSIVKSKIESGQTDFSIKENGYTDGEVLIVAYKNQSTSGGTAIILDGGLAQGGDTTRLDFASPYTGGDAFLSLAISYSYGDFQNTKVTVKTSSNPNGRLLTSAAGGNDDGSFQAADGALITVGGVGDSPLNPPNPNQTGAAYDDELYNLALGNDVSADPFLRNGDTWLELLTNNPSGDDNVFATFFTSTFRIANVNDDDIINPDGPNPVPEPSTVLLLATGALGLAYLRRKN